MINKGRLCHANGKYSGGLEIVVTVLLGGGGGGWGALSDIVQA